MTKADAPDVNYDDELNSSRSGREKTAERLASDSDAISISTASRIPSIIFPAVYALILFVLCLAYGVIPGPELIALSFLIYAAYNKRSRRFVKDWFPFVSLILGYEALNTLVPSLNHAIHYIEPINADKQLFGSIPTLILQQYLRTPILDYTAAFFYSLHFILPILFAFILWKYKPAFFGRYTLALVVGTYSALITYLLYPVAPPWYGLWQAFRIPETQTRILFQLDGSLGVPFYQSFFDFAQSNKFAAFPSLHAMYPWLISLYALRIKGTKALPILIIPFGVWFSTIYLGEHYVIDVIGAVIYGICAFLFVERVVPFLTQRFSKIRS
jgi:membrane-associated phospholipid phosphatase